MGLLTCFWKAKELFGGYIWWTLANLQLTAFLTLQKYHMYFMSYNRVVHGCITVLFCKYEMELHVWVYVCACMSAFEGCEGCVHMPWSIKKQV